MTLKEAARNEIRNALSELVPIWENEPLLDQRRSVRPSGAGAFVIDIEKYRGFQTFIRLQKQLEAHPTTLRLQEMLRSAEPRLFGFIDCAPLLSRRRIRNAWQLVSWWCNYLTETPHGQPKRSIDTLLVELDSLLRDEKVIAETISPLAGLTLPEDVDEIVMGDGLKLRRLSVEEIGDLGTSDLYTLADTDIVTRSITTALTVTNEVSCRLVTEAIEGPIDSGPHRKIIEKIDRFLSSLSVLKAGRVSVVSTQTRLRPAVLPGMLGGKSQPLTNAPFERMELASTELSELPGTYTGLERSPLSELRIATDRLRESEQRLSLVDSLLDAMIGLESLLNPHDLGELAFRVAVNYAFLAPSNERRTRYETIKELQKTRNLIVHGGRQARNLPGIHAQAETARACLRDTIRLFLSDSSLNRVAKLDAQMWLDRIIPPN